MDMLFLYQTYRTREVDDDKIPINSRNIYDRTFYHILQSSNFKEWLKPIAFGDKTAYSFAYTHMALSDI